MLDHRVYRAAFVPALLVTAIVAFSLVDRPPPATTPLGTQAFDAARAFGGDPPPPTSLQGMVAAFPRRRPGSVEDNALAALVERTLKRDLGATHVRTVEHRGHTAEGNVPLRTVIATRTGTSNRRIVVVAHRDALGRGAAAELSGTAVLLELARVFATQDVRKTLVLASTSGGAGGAGLAGARDALGSPGDIDAVLVLGDLASERTRRPWVVTWANGAEPSPLALRRSVEAAVREEVGSDPGGSRASAQWMRRAVPLTLGEQGAADGLPAVLLSATGERGPAADAPVSSRNFERFGRAALRAVDAIDDAGAGGGPAFTGEADGLVTLKRVIPQWAIRALVIAYLVPALLAALDAFFRARRRKLLVQPWVLWLGAGALPVLAAWLWARALGLTGVLAAPPGVVRSGAIALSGWRVAALVVGVLLLAGLGAAAPAIARRRLGLERASLATGGAAAAMGAVLAASAFVIWIFNPWAAALLVPAAHLWLLAVTAPGRPRHGAAVVVLLAGLLAPLACLVVYMVAFGLGPLGVTWSAFLAAAGGALGPTFALALAVFTACGAATVRILLARGRQAAADGSGPISTRGPVSYAGPGSLGGTDSALRF